MPNKVLTVSIIGVGARGGETYGRYIHSLKDRYSIVSLCDLSRERLDKYGKDFEVAKENRFLSEEDFFRCKRSDILLIGTMDASHVRIAERALSLGYHLLLEKPISGKLDELRRLVEVARASGKIVMVCHVLRYTAMVEKLKNLLDGGAIGKLISMDQTENVAFWHQAHSFVRGNWRKKEETSPMILQKCCHDFDLIQYFVGARCKALSSMGDLSYLNPKNHPEGAADRCVSCKFIETCPYSAKKIYIDMWKENGRNENIWPMNVITDEFPLTEENLTRAITEGPYGRCVFACDNNVVDNQTVMMQFENGITATLKMEAFTKAGGRDIRFFGTSGELCLYESEGLIVLKRYFGNEERWTLSELTDDLEGHGGGDHRMIDRLYRVLTSENPKSIDTTIENSVESHYMAIAAEESRLAGGKLTYISEYRS